MRFTAAAALLLCGATAPPPRPRDGISGRGRAAGEQQASDPQSTSAARAQLAENKSFCEGTAGSKRTAAAEADDRIEAFEADIENAFSDAERLKKAMHADEVLHADYSQSLSALQWRTDVFKKQAHDRPQSSFAQLADLNRPTKMSANRIWALGDAGTEASPWPEACVANYSWHLEGARPGLGNAMRQMLLKWRSRPLPLVKSSQRPIVFGVGAGTTGTHSLASALRMLNLTGWHYNDDDDDAWAERAWTAELLNMMYGNNDTASEEACYVGLQDFDYTALPEGVEFVMDDPVDQVFLHLFAAFPNARFVLTTRPALEWAAARRWHNGNTLAPVQDACRNASLDDFPEDEDLGLVLQLHQELVRCVVPSERLLEFDLFADDAERQDNLMRELAAFLGRPAAADVAFPHDG